MSFLTDNDLTRAATLTPANGDELIHLLAKLLKKATRVRGFLIPDHNYVATTYVGSTNNKATEVFKSGGSGGTTVATLTYTYAASGAADNDRVTSVTLS